MKPEETYTFAQKSTLLLLILGQRILLFPKCDWKGIADFFNKEPTGLDTLPVVLQDVVASMLGANWNAETIRESYRNLITSIAKAPKAPKNLLTLIDDVWSTEDKQFAVTIMHMLTYMVTEEIRKPN